MVIMDGVQLVEVERVMIVHLQCLGGLGNTALVL